VFEFRSTTLEPAIPAWGDSFRSIDRSFVAGLGHSRDAEAIVCAVIRLGRSLGLRVFGRRRGNGRTVHVPTGGGLRRGAGFPHRPAVASGRLRGTARRSPLSDRAAPRRPVIEFTSSEKPVRNLRGSLLSPVSAVRLVVQVRSKQSPGDPERSPSACRSPRHGACRVPGTRTSGLPRRRSNANVHGPSNAYGDCKVPGGGLATLCTISRVVAVDTASAAASPTRLGMASTAGASPQSAGRRGSVRRCRERAALGAGSRTHTTG